MWPLGSFIYCLSFILSSAFPSNMEMKMYNISKWCWGRAGWCCPVTPYVPECQRTYVLLVSPCLLLASACAHLPFPVCIKHGIALYNSNGAVNNLWVSVRAFSQPYSMVVVLLLLLRLVLVLGVCGVWSVELTDFFVWECVTAGHQILANFSYRIPLSRTVA